MGFLRERFSKSTENNNPSLIIYRNDNIARLFKDVIAVIMRRMLIHGHTSLIPNSYFYGRDSLIMPVFVGKGITMLVLYDFMEVFIREERLIPNSHF